MLDLVLSCVDYCKAVPGVFLPQGASVLHVAAARLVLNLNLYDIVPGTAAVRRRAAVKASDRNQPLRKWSQTAKIPRRRRR